MVWALNLALLKVKDGQTYKKKKKKPFLAHSFNSSSAQKWADWRKESMELCLCCKFTALCVNSNTHRSNKCCLTLFMLPLFISNKPNSFPSLQPNKWRHLLLSISSIFHPSNPIFHLHPYFQFPIPVGWKPEAPRDLS